MIELHGLLARALARREALIAQCGDDQTDCYRLFHGAVEGRPGLTVDRYGSVVLIQSFHEPLEPADLELIEASVRMSHPSIGDLVYNDRSAVGSRIRNRTPGDELAAEGECVVHELGVAYRFRARHKGSDPWLFLDLRAVRRFIRDCARGTSVLNLFAYTCGVGVAAAVAGADRVLNVDFARSSLEVGRDNASLNAVGERIAYLESDFFPAARQLAGLGLPKPRRHGSLPSTPRVEPESFGVVVLDPPRLAKSAFGVVDLVHDYAAVFRPALLATREGGTLICCNNVARVAVEPWLDGLSRAARKNGRTISDLQVLQPEADFPSLDGDPPLKVAVLRV